jgi:putative tryptophan/tyrosine transport system substrate-binding protein
MRRREFISLLGCGLAAGWPHRVKAQSSKVYRVGLALTTSPLSEMAGPDPIQPSARAFVHGLRDLGYVEGQNLILERRSAEGHPERYHNIIEELVQLNVDVIVTVTAPMIREAKAITSTVPIVMGSSTWDVLNLGLFNSLGKPGGNITGNISLFDPEIDAKRLELLKEMLPSASRVACLSRIEEWESPWGQSVEVAAQKLGLTMVLAAHTPDNYERALALITASRVDALFLYPGSYQYGNRKMLVDFASKNRLPDSHGFREAVEIGGLMSYGANQPALWRGAATYVDKILKGANPGELPIMQPTKFEFVINRRTADALGIPVPPSLIALTDEVIE